jgi:acetyl esterase/lipase
MSYSVTINFAILIQVPLAIRKQLQHSINADFIPVEQRYPPYKPKSYTADAETTEFWNKFGDMFLDPYVTPLLAESHANLSEALIISAQFDMLRDDSYLYARKLRMAGIPVTHYNNPVGMHAISMLYEMFEDGDYELSYTIEFMKSRLQ